MRLVSERRINLKLLSTFSGGGYENNSIQPQLTDSMKLMMSQLYNETTLLYPGAVLSNYFPGEPLYIQVDTVVDGTTYTIYQQSTNSDEVLYRLNFSYLGVGKGNYKLNVAATNGRAFMWVPHEWNSTRRI